MCKLLLDEGADVLAVDDTNRLYLAILTFGFNTD
jgi:hypothetical protein